YLGRRLVTAHHSAATRATTRLGTELDDEDGDDDAEEHIDEQRLRGLTHLLEHGKNASGKVLGRTRHHAGAQVGAESTTKAPRRAKGRSDRKNGSGRRRGAYPLLVSCAKRGNFF